MCYCAFTRYEGFQIELNKNKKWWFFEKKKTVQNLLKQSKDYDANPASVITYVKTEKYQLTT